MISIGKYISGIQNGYMSGFGKTNSIPFSGSSETLPERPFWSDASSLAISTGICTRPISTAGVAGMNVWPQKGNAVAITTNQPRYLLFKLKLGKFMQINNNRNNPAHGT